MVPTIGERASIHRARTMSKTVTIMIVSSLVLTACPYDASEADDKTSEQKAGNATDRSASTASNAAGATASTAPRRNVKRVPPDDVLCKLFIGNLSNSSTYEISGGCCYDRVIGTHINDVKNVLGEPYAKPQEDTWVYLWCTGDRCQTDAKATLHFEFAPRCKLDTGESVSPSYWLHGIQAEGFDFRPCWDGLKRDSLRAPCDECLNLASVDECSKVKGAKP